MASEKVTDLTAYSSIKTTDTYHVVDTTDTSQDPAGSSYKVTWATWKAAILAFFSAGTGITFSGGIISSDPTATQTLTNKTLTSPTINTATISSPTISGTTTLNGTYAGSMVVPLSNGGTGASSQPAAAIAVLPSMSGQTGNFLTTDGSNASWGSPSALNQNSAILTSGPSLTSKQAVAIFPFQTDGGVQIDTKGGATQSTGASLVTNITVGTNSNRVLVVYGFSASSNITSVTYGGAAMTQIDTQTLFGPGSSARGASYVLVAPATGTNSLVVTYSGSATEQTVQWWSLFNASQSSVPETHVSDKNSASTLSLSTIANGALVITASMSNSGTNGGSAIYENAQTTASIISWDSSQVFPAATSVFLSKTSTTAGSFMLSIAPVTSVTYSVSPSSSASTTNQYYNRYSAFIGFANASVSGNTSVTVVVGGVVSGMSGLAQGQQYYLNDTAGTIGVSPGTNTRKVGIAISTTQLLITNNW